MDFGKRMRSIDIFKKVPKDITMSTNLGGFISILTAFLILFLFLREASIYRNPEYIAEISNDKLFTR